MKNPFTIKVVSDKRYFCNRTREIDKLVRHAENETNVVLFSPRRYGKTSLVRQVQSRLASRKFITVFIDLFGLSREEFLQLNVKDVIPPEQYQKSDKEFAKLNEEGKYEKFIGKQRTKDGRWLDIEVSASAIIKNGKLIGSRDIVRDITVRRREEAKKEKLIVELQNALAEIKTLRGILPICSYCKKIRDDEGYWNQVDAYIKKHTKAEFTHGICPECAKKHFAELFEKV